MGSTCMYGTSTYVYHSYTRVAANFPPDPTPTSTASENINITSATDESLFTTSITNILWYPKTMAMRITVLDNGRYVCEYSSDIISNNGETKQSVYKSSVTGSWAITILNPPQAPCTLKGTPPSILSGECITPPGRGTTVTVCKRQAGWSPQPTNPESASISSTEISSVLSISVLTSGASTKTSSVQSIKLSASDTSTGASSSQTDGSFKPNSSFSRKMIAAVAAIATFSIILFLVLCFCFNRRRRSKVRKIQNLGVIEENTPNYEVSQTGSKVENGHNRKSSSIRIPLLSRPRSEIILDDSAILKLFNELDNSITDHVINYWQNNEITSTQYQTYLNTPASRESWTGILYHGRPLLANMEARIPMFRAILAYHVYTAIFDWRVLSPPQQDRISEGLSRRRAILQTLEKSEADIINRAHLIYNLLERESRPHISPESSINPLYEESLRQIAKEVVSLSLTLGMQADAFKFEFRNKDSDETTPTNMLAVRLLGEPGTNNDTMEIVNGMDGTIRALVSPGIIRISKTRKENVIRKAQVFTA